MITTATAGHAVEIDVDITGARQLYLVVNDGGNGFACDWADWAEPRLIGPEGEKKLTDLKWRSASAEWGQVRAGANADGSPLRIAGKPVEYGIGTHANSLIVYDLPEGFTRFRSRGGLDNGGTDQSGGTSTSVRFLVYTRQPPASVTASSQSSVSASHDAEDAVAGLDVADGLEATLFASEPTLLSLTNLDVDHRGRVWVCEVVNYRGHNGERPEGDRILILQDTDGDGVADSSQVYYQGREIDSAMGICVLGNRVIVSCSPNIWVFTDDDGDDRPDRKEALFTNTGQPQHDHSAHSFLFGPDGRLYWNFGNTGREVHDRDGNLVVDMAGNAVADRRQPYTNGMVFRCNPDGSNFEVLGHNFRNNYEVTVDSFGTLWQSDNDDDGNRGVRINYVMEYGNYGYVDEMTGAGWRTERTGMNEEIPLRHWHQNDPGVVPNLLQTGAGSPTGITVYEGRLLPEVFWDQVIHCDAGPNVVRAYPVARDGAGYTAEIVDVLHGARDNWFRPADVCVAPDGSLFVTDWYDPGVGGHAMRDMERGRLFRVAPAGCRYEVPQFDFTTPEGAVDALRNPNLATRYLAWTALHEMGERAEPALQRLLDDPNPRLRARALWLLGRLAERGQEYVATGLRDADPDVRAAAIRVARQQGMEIVPIVTRLVRDPSPQVRRELAIALRHNDSSEAAGLWAELAAQHDGRDRWYLEALGIAADGQWDAFLGAWLKEIGDNWRSAAGRDVIWRSRAAATPQYLAQIISDPATPPETLPRYFRAFDFQQGPEKEPALHRLLDTLVTNTSQDAAARDAAIIETLTRRGAAALASSPAAKTALVRYLQSQRGTSRYLDIVEQLQFKDAADELLQLSIEKPDQTEGVRAAGLLIRFGAADRLKQVVDGEDEAQAVNAVKVIGQVGGQETIDWLLPLVSQTKRSLAVRSAAVAAMSNNTNAQRKLLQTVRDNQLPADLQFATANVLLASRDEGIRNQAAQYLTLPPSADQQPLPTIQELVKRRGDADNGRQIFAEKGTCAKCHKIGELGKEVGPDLSEIGDKLSSEAMYVSILDPSAGISHNYETYLLALDSGVVLSGILVSETAESVTIKNEEAVVRTIPKGEIEEMAKQKKSLMPADLQKNLTVQELVDVVEYLKTLKK